MRGEHVADCCGMCVSVLLTVLLTVVADSVADSVADNVADSVADCCRGNGESAALQEGTGRTGRRDSRETRVPEGSSVTRATG